MTWTLRGYGPQDWAQVVRQAAGMTCAWADTTGFHIGACPDRVPAYSHLWGWAGDRSSLLRARIDGDQAILGVLTTAGSDPQALLNEPVQVRQEQQYTWGPQDATIGEQPPEVLPGKVTAYRVLGPMPVIFIAGESDA